MPGLGMKESDSKKEELESLMDGCAGGSLMV